MSDQDESSGQEPTSGEQRFRGNRAGHLPFVWGCFLDKDDAVLAARDARPSMGSSRRISHSSSRAAPQAPTRDPPLRAHGLMDAESPLTAASGMTGREVPPHPFVWARSAGKTHGRCTGRLPPTVLGLPVPLYGVVFAERSRRALPPSTRPPLHGLVPSNSPLVAPDAAFAAIRGPPSRAHGRMDAGQALSAASGMTK